MSDENKQLNLPVREEKILEMWGREKIFEKTLAKTKKGKPFVFYEGPPTANALPGIHHVEARAFKDLIPRYKTMRGFFVARKAGWDTHGLPVELAVEKALGFKTKKDIEKFGIAQFNEKCRESVWKYKAEWEKLTKRIGYWLDLEHPYITDDPKYMETLWRVVKEIWKSGLLYKDFKVVPWCPRCETGLSSHELGQPGAYQKVTEKSIYVKLKIVGRENEFLLVWTTTPWTLPANVAVALNPKIEYTKYHIGGEDYWSATTPPHDAGDDIAVIEKVSGKSLLGLQYEPLCKLQTTNYKLQTKAIPYETIAGDFVETDEGTGFVHLAPAFGDDDMRAVKQKYGAEYPILHTVNENGTMKKGVVGEGKFVKDADKDIIDDLQKRKLLYRAEMHEHDYPHCWRCGTPILYFAKDAWWIRMSELRGELLKQNKTINWIPQHLQNGRFGEFLAEVRDWAFSRERYWGTPLPVWECPKCQHREVIGGFDELAARAKKSGNEYILMRHGESEAQMMWVTDDDKKMYHLTDGGKKQVLMAAKKLKKEKIDVIVASDVLRTRETADIVALALGIKKIEIDSRIREIHVGIFEHKSPDEYHRYYSSTLEKFTKQPPDGESLNDVKKRVMEALLDLEKKYRNKKILIVSHEYPIWILWGAAQGMSNEEMAEEKEKQGRDFMKLASVALAPYKTLPRDARGEVNLHRPYVDDFVLECPKCGSEIKRAPEVIDVWFDSGAMPFAANEAFAAKIRNPKFEIRNLSNYPADYIAEAIDQTRGWFYTLLAVATLLGKGAPYKNVISLGHVLDKNGQKMSKSKGNVVDPWMMIEKYGADVIRWYFYTINHPGDPKLFDEKELLLKQRGFFGTLWNSYQLFNTYVDKIRNPKPHAYRQAGEIRNKFKISKSKNILDTWILTRLNELVAGVTKDLDEYEIMNAARLIEEFVIGDFSQWFLRRSRRRFQKPETVEEKNEAAQTSAYVLLTLAKLIAPFTPFFAEILYQELRKKMGLKAQSVHLENWPLVANYKLQTTNCKLLDDMKMAREIVAEALKLRAEAGIKVRQPLRELSIKNQELRERIGLLELIKDEVNVKEIIFGEELKLDTVISPELREEGLVREFIRNIQEMRKDAGFLPRHYVRIYLSGSSVTESVFEKWAGTIKKEANAKELKIGGKKKFTIERDAVIDGQKVWVGLDRI